MTKNQKYKQIIDRLKQQNIEFDEGMLSCLIITSYLSKFQELNLLEGSVSITNMGRAVTSVCQEFDWQPSNQEITECVNVLVETNDNEKLIELLILYRDNPEQFLENYNKSKL